MVGFNVALQNLKNQEVHLNEISYTMHKVQKKVGEISMDLKNVNIMGMEDVLSEIERKLSIHYSETKTLSLCLGKVISEYLNMEKIC